MPTLQFTRTVDVHAPAPQVWTTVTDVTRLVEWISIVHSAVEIERLQRYSAVLQDRLGPFRLRADLDITMDEVVENELLVGRARGEDRQMGAQISVDARLLLAQQGDVTTLTVEGSYEVSGRIATLGTSMITKKAQHIIDEFVGRLRTELG